MTQNRPGDISFVHSLKAQIVEVRKAIIHVLRRSAVRYVLPCTRVFGHIGNAKVLLECNLVHDAFGESLISRPLPVGASGARTACRWPHILPTRVDQHYRPAARTSATRNRRVSRRPAIGGTSPHHDPLR